MSIKTDNPPASDFPASNLQAPKLNSTNRNDLSIETEENQKQFHNRMESESIIYKIGEFIDSLNSINKIVFYNEEEISSIKYPAVGETIFTNYLNSDNYDDYKRIYESLAIMMSSVKSFMSNLHENENSETLEVINTNRNNYDNIAKIFKSKWPNDDFDICDEVFIMKFRLKKEKQDTKSLKTLKDSFRVFAFYDWKEKNVMISLLDPFHLVTPFGKQSKDSLLNNAKNNLCHNKIFK